jgi:[ribosomal protein S5]-alanine N-acetyltransferase
VKGILRTARLTLRPLSLNDADALLQVFGDEETMRFWSTGPVTSLDAMRERLARNVVPDDSPANVFAIAESESGPARGWVSLYAFKDGNAGAGYILNKAVRGRGYAREALAALLDYAFDIRNVHRIFLEIDPENTASIRLAQSMGFRWEAWTKESFLREGVYLDDLTYAILAREWRALRA